MKAPVCFTGTTPAPEICQKCQFCEKNKQLFLKYKSSRVGGKPRFGSQAGDRPKGPEYTGVWRDM